MCFRVLLATACFALAVHAQEASGSCPILCVNGECKPISSPGHEGHYICECTPPFRGDSCSVQSAAATSSPQPSASRTPQPSARSTPQPTAAGDNLSTIRTSATYLPQHTYCAHTYPNTAVSEDSCTVLPLLNTWVAAVQAHMLWKAALTPARSSVYMGSASPYQAQVTKGTTSVSANLLSEATPAMCSPHLYRVLHS